MEALEFTSVIPFLSKGGIPIDGDIAPVLDKLSKLQKARERVEKKIQQTEGQLDGSQNYKRFNIKASFKNVHSLGNPKFHKEEARRFFQWMQNNLPHGVFQELKKLFKD